MSEIKVPKRLFVAGSPRRSAVLSLLAQNGFEPKERAIVMQVFGGLSSTAKKDFVFDLVDGRGEVIRQKYL